MSKIDNLSFADLCSALRQIGRQDHSAKMCSAVITLDRALNPSVTYDYMPALTRLRALEAEGRDIVRAAVAARRSA